MIFPISKRHWCVKDYGSGAAPSIAMIPIHELLNRIRWDESLAKGSFVIGYYDRVEKSIVRVPFDRVQLEPGNHFSFQVSDADGYAHEVPFHRVKALYKDGQLIWHREH